MTTRAELRQRVREELNDAASVQLWSDALLDRYMAEGLRELGRRLGLEKTTSLTSVAGQAAYGLPADTIAPIRVEHPSSVMRVPGGPRSGDGVPTDGRVAWGGGGTALPGYEVFGGQLVLTPAPAASGEEIRVRYRGAYAEPATDASVLDVPQRDEALVVLYACGRALRWIGTDEAKRQHFERRRGAAPGELRREYERELGRMLRDRRSQVETRRLVAR